MLHQAYCKICGEITELSFKFKHVNDFAIAIIRTRFNCQSCGQSFHLLDVSGYKDLIRRYIRVEGLGKPERDIMVTEGRTS